MRQRQRHQHAAAAAPRPFPPAPPLLFLLLLAAARPRPATAAFDALPNQTFHESRYLAFSPDGGKLYFGIGARGKGRAGPQLVSLQSSRLAFLHGALTPHCPHCPHRCGQVPRGTARRACPPAVPAGVHTPSTLPALPPVFVAAGTPCDVCSAGGWRKNATAPWFKYGSIYRMTPDGTGVQRWASGEGQPGSPRQPARGQGAAEGGPLGAVLNQSINYI